MTNRAFAVLGMHRSGTSCLTAMMEHAGIHLGTVSRHNKFNLRGNHENPLILKLSDNLLVECGGDWRLPPSVVTWTTKHKRVRDQIITSYAHVDCWGFKDPRTLFTLDGWLEALPNLNLIGIFRHPHSVALSLHRRNSDLSIEEGYKIWFAYNKKLYYYLDKYKFPILKFEAQGFLDDFERIRKKFKLPAQHQAEREDIYDPSLHSKTSQNIQLPDEVEILFNKLNERVIQN
ncbi:MAG: hypothetical protein L3J24_03905 [Xanthomonadales bacterium]|nr:hypothetical protein [Xanthomonadales bacterium]